MTDNERNCTEVDMPAGRPTKYTPELLEKAYEYLYQWEELGDPIPMLCGLAVHCDINKGTVSDWQNDEEKGEFSEICARIMAEQERVLLQKGLTRIHDNSLTKLLLMRHGYSDKQEIDHTSGGEKITGITRKIVD